MDQKTALGPNVGRLLWQGLWGCGFGLESPRRPREMPRRVFYFLGGEVHAVGLPERCGEHVKWGNPANPGFKGRGE